MTVYVYNAPAYPIRHNWAASTQQVTGRHVLQGLSVSCELYL